MAINGLILSVERLTGPNGEKYPSIKVDQGGGATVNAVLMTDPNVDSLPLPGDVATIDPTKRNGKPNASGCVDPKADPIAQPGEFRATARTEGGAVVAAVHVKADGSVVVTTEAGDNTFNPDGSVEFSNGAQLDPAGDYITATGISLNTHRHVGNLGAPTGPAIP